MSEKNISTPKDPLLDVRGLRVHFPVRRGLFSRVVGHVAAVDDVSFSIARGETLGMVGESGCGKTTIGRAILRLIEPTEGEVYFGGRDLLHLRRPEMRKMRQRMQVIFQDPYSSLNPRMTIGAIVGEGLKVHQICKGAELRDRVETLLDRVGLSPDVYERFPHEFSGGQRQRIGIARALSLKPRFVVCDEAVSALDVSIQAQILNLLLDLRDELGLAYLFISHDLSVIRQVSDRVVVMYLGQIVEHGPADAIFQSPAHPYTRALLAAVPVPDPTKRRTRALLQGEVPSPMEPPSGCRFHSRCPIAEAICSREKPPWKKRQGNHGFLCHLDGDAKA